MLRALAGQIALEIQRAGRLESYTYGELRRMAETIGCWLRDQPLESGTRVAIFAENHPRWVAVFLGIIAAGQTAVPLDTALQPDQLLKLMVDSGTSYLL